MRNEPVFTIATITSAAAAVLGLVVSFGVPLSDAQMQAILGLTSVLAPLAAAMFARSRVSPVCASQPVPEPAPEPTPANIQ